MPAIPVTRAEIEAVQAGITRLLTEGHEGLSGQIVWHLGPRLGQVQVELPLRGAPGRVCQAYADLLSAAQGIAR